MSHEANPDVEIRELKAFKVAYIRNRNIHQHDSAAFGIMFEQLFSWADTRNLLNFPETQALTVYRSDANLSGMLAADVCITVPETTVGEAVIETTSISGGLYAVFHKEASLSECFKKWNFYFEVWFEENGYQPDNRDFFLRNRKESKTHPQHYAIVDIYLPIKPH
jgi:AraC family transcriptional regulator